MLDEISEPIHKISIKAKLNFNWNSTKPIDARNNKKRNKEEYEKPTDEE